MYYIYIYMCVWLYVYVIVCVYGKVLYLPTSLGSVWPLRPHFCQPLSSLQDGDAIPHGQHGHMPAATLQDVLVELDHSCGGRVMSMAGSQYPGVPKGVVHHDQPECQ